MQPQTPQQANMGLGARGSNPQHLNQITLHTTSGIVRMIQPQNHQLFAPIQIQGQNQQVSLSPTPSSSPSPRQLLLSIYPQQQLSPSSSPSHNSPRQQQQLVSTYPQQLIRRSSTTQSISSGQMKLISAVQGSGGGSGDGGGVVGGGQQQILISVPTSQHLGDLNLVPSGLPEHALPGNNMDANLPTNPHQQQAVILSPSSGQQQVIQLDGLRNLQDGSGRTIVVTSLGKLQLQQLQQAGKLQVSSGQLIVSSAIGGQIISGQPLRYTGVGGTQQIRLVSRSSPSIVSQAIGVVSQNSGIASFNSRVLSQNSGATTVATPTPGGGGTIMVCQPVVMSSAESLPTSGGANQIIANIGQVRLQPKQQRPPITGRQQIFFRVRRPTTPVVAAATAANTNNVRYLTPRSAVTLASAAGGIVRSATPIIQQNAVSFRGSRGGRPRGASPRQLRPQIAANNPVFVSAGSSPQITGSQVVHVKRSNLSMMSPDDLPDLPLDIQEKIVQFSGSSSSQSSQQSYNTLQHSGVTTTLPSSSGVTLVSSNSKSEHPTASHPPSHPANMAIVRPQQLIQQEQNLAQLTQSAARPQQIIHPQEQHIPQSVARPTQVILRSHPNITTSSQQQLLIRQQPQPQPQGTISLAIPVSALKPALSAAGIPMAGLKPATAGAFSGNIQFLTPVKQGNGSTTYLAAPSSSSGSSSQATIHNIDNSGQGPLQSISLDQFSTSTGKVLMQGTTPVSQGIQDSVPGADTNQGPVQGLDLVQVPWGWKRILINNYITYFSPSGIQLKNLEDVKEYLMAEGTCKCGLDCPFKIQDKFDFNPQKPSEVVKPLTAVSGGCGCEHEPHTKSLAQLHTNTGLTIRHLNNPLHALKDGKKKKGKKKKPFHGVLVSEMIAAREAEKNRINEIIAREKALHEAKRRETELGNKNSIPQTSTAKPLTTQRQPQLGVQQQRIILPQHPLPQQILMQQVASPMTSLQHSTNQVPSYKQDVVTSYVSTNQGTVFSNQPMTSQIVSTNGMQQYIISSTQSPIYTVSTSKANPRQELIYATAGNNELMQQQTGFETRQYGAADNVSVAQMISQGQLNPSSQQVVSQHGHQLQLSRASNVSSVSSPLAGLVQIEVPLPLPEEALANEVAFEAEEDVKEEQADSNLHFVDENIGIDPNIVYSTANLQDETNIQQEQIIHMPFPQSLSDMQSSVHFEPSHHESFEPPEQLLDEDMDDNLEQETFLPNEEATNIENVEMYASENETGEVNEPMEDNNQEDYDSNDEGDREMKTRESLPTPTRSTLPGMIIPSGLMSLSSAANIFRAESISSKSSSRRSSVDGGQPTTPQQSTDNSTRAYSLAEAMQAARKLNMDKALSASSPANTPTKQPEIASVDNIAEEETENQSESEDNNLDDNIPVEEDARTADNAKNIEIRRMSSTEEGFKILEPNFHSPEKDGKKNPLQNIFNIVSEMEVPTEEIETAPPKTKVRKRLQYSMLNPAMPGQAAWVLKGVSANNSTAVLTPSATTSVSYIQAGGTIQQASQPLIMTAAPTSAIPLQAAAQQQQVMQLVQTINGPVLVPVGYQTTILPASPAIPISTAPQLGNKDDSFSDQSSSPESARASPANVGKGKSRRTRKRKASGDNDKELPDNNGSQLITVAQQQGIIQQPNLSHNIVLTSGVGGNQMVLQNPAGTLVAMPAQAPQGIIYQQLADGRMIQLQAPSLIQPGPSHQIVPAQYIMTPQGLVQALPAPAQAQQVLLPTSADQQLIMPRSADSPQLLLPAQHFGGSHGANNKNVTKNVENRDDSLDNSDDENDCVPSTSRGVISPAASIQSNKVDSSGLNATPPHNRELHEYEQLRDCVSPEMDGDMDASVLSGREGRIMENMDGRQGRTMDNMDETGEKTEEETDSESDKAVSSSAWDKAVSASKKRGRPQGNAGRRKLHADRGITQQDKQDRSDNSTNITPPTSSPHEEGGSGGDTSPTRQQERPQFSEGEIVWGPVEGHNSWPGKVVEVMENGMVLVCWYGGRTVSQVNYEDLLTLSEGLDAHHKERKKIRRGRRMNENLEKAIQEAMMELD